MMFMPVDEPDIIKEISLPIPIKRDNKEHKSW